MIERLQQVLTRIEQLPPEVQEEAATQLEMLAEPFEAIPNAKTNRTRRKGRNLDRMRHATEPTPPIDL